MLRIIIEFLLFAASTGVFFNERLKGNIFAVLVAGSIAVASTISLFLTVPDLFSVIGRSNSTAEVATKPPPQKICVTFNGVPRCSE
jgi:hypothetical protein